jgi:hypothetical protein
VFAAIVIAAIPPLFQLATSVLEYVKSEAQLAKNKQQFRETYIKDFLADALNQDIELRIRFAEYFSFVSSDEFRQGWIDYHQHLVQYRDTVRKQIDEMETKWQQKSQISGQNDPEIDRLERDLSWAYHEMGYVERDRSVVRNPRIGVLPASVPTNPEIRPGDYKVFVQFAGVLRRDDVRDMMKNLHDVGWNVLGIDGGGQRTSAAAGYNEIRYGDSGDASAAQALAKAVQTTNITLR